ncbi:hypothetical protein SASPL_129359 [Salvia splendens]|uniref:Uncharacterized protein n=1 Tax=Salvia splendens TaxID=180675 RepID=A0A8X8ZNN9_SALSN|nr:hypothetical protein SASPL_129359 [Salvia splendens]
MTKFKPPSKRIKTDPSISSSSKGIQQARDYAVAQAKQDGCTGNFRVFDSPFGNFLVPVIPTRAQLGGLDETSSACIPTNTAGL